SAAFLKRDVAKFGRTTLKFARTSAELVKRGSVRLARGIANVARSTVKAVPPVSTYLFGFGTGLEGALKLNLLNLPTTLPPAHSKLEQIICFGKIGAGFLASCGAASRLDPDLAVAVKYNVQIVTDFIASKTKTAARLSDVTNDAI